VARRDRAAICWQQLGPVLLVLVGLLSQLLLSLRPVYPPLDIGPSMFAVVPELQPLSFPLTACAFSTQDCRYTAAGNATRAAFSFLLAEDPFVNVQWQDLSPFVRNYPAQRSPAAMFRFLNATLNTSSPRIGSYVVQSIPVVSASQTQLSVIVMANSSVSYSLALTHNILSNVV
jgi:hypothetical protein